MIAVLFGTPAQRGDWLVGSLCFAWLLLVLWIAVPENDLLRALWTDTMAAWIQAAGSLAAIATAIGLSVHQAREARRERIADYKRARGDRIDGIAALMEDVYWQLKLASNAASDPEPMEWLDFILIRFDPERFQRSVSALQNAPIHEMGNWNLVLSAIQMREVGIRGAFLLGRLGTQAKLTGAFDDRHEVCDLFSEANELMRPIVHAQALGYFTAPAFGEWKEHFDLPEGLIAQLRSEGAR